MSRGSVPPTVPDTRALGPNAGAVAMSSLGSESPTARSTLNDWVSVSVVLSDGFTTLAVIVPTPALLQPPSAAVTVPDASVRPATETIDPRPWSENVTTRPSREPWPSTVAVTLTCGVVTLTGREN